MITTKNLGIWMDHSNAHLMTFINQIIESKNMDSKFTHEAKEQSLGKSENLMHNKEQHQQSEFYKKLGEVILNYDSVILFGPTDAKTELLNVLKADHLFAKIKIEAKPADKMTEKQEHAFVRNYFAKHRFV